MQEVKAAGAVIYKIEKQAPMYLILRSVYHGEWGPPKGHADEGENEIETAMREIFEETGIGKATFIPGFRATLSYVVDKKGKKYNKEVIYFLSKLPDVEVKISREHSEAQFATLDEIEHVVRHDDLKSIFRKADAFIRKLPREV